MYNALKGNPKAFSDAGSRVKIVEDVNLLVEMGTKEVKRSWKERLFSRPWKPWMSTKTVPNYVPDPNVYRLLSGAILAHPVAAGRLRKYMNDYEKEN